MLASFDACILYDPLKKEVSYNDSSFPFYIPPDRIVLPNSKTSDPQEWARKCHAKFRNNKVYILAPGRHFDLYGTRHGKGGGWYDRFLSKVPTAWLRIGIADKSQVSDTKISKQNWDESVDWVIVRDGSLWNAYKCKIDRKKNDFN